MTMAEVVSDTVGVSGGSHSQSSIVTCELAWHHLSAMGSFIPNSTAVVGHPVLLLLLCVCVWGGGGGVVCLAPARCNTVRTCISRACW
jgi:hypothetical protein